MTDPTITVRVLEGQAVHAIGRSYGTGEVFTVPVERAQRLVEIGACECHEPEPTPKPDPVAVDHVEVRVPGGFRSLPRAEARELIAAGKAEPLFPGTL
jgi:hypothetical protein